MVGWISHKGGNLNVFSNPKVCMIYNTYKSR